MRLKIILFYNDSDVWFITVSWFRKFLFFHNTPCNLWISLPATVPSTYYQQTSSIALELCIFNIGNHLKVLFGNELFDELWGIISTADWLLQIGWAQRAASSPHIPNTLCKHDRCFMLISVEFLKHWIFIWFFNWDKANSHEFST